VYVNGQLLGGMGDFTSAEPTLYSIRPRIYSLPEVHTPGRTLVIAFRVWMPAWATGDPAAGGIRIAPCLGETAGIEARYRAQWLQTVKGYIVEVVEALLFVLLAGIAASLTVFERGGGGRGGGGGGGGNRAYLWLAAALVITAIYRANQALYFWAGVETVQGYELLIRVLVYPLGMAAYLRAWWAWFHLDTPSWPRRAVPVLAGIYMIAEFLRRSWFYGYFPYGIDVALRYLILGVRLSFLVLLVLITWRGIRGQGRAGWVALPAVLAIAVALFAQELSAIHVPGIWFPFGTGVSRTQYAYVVFDIALASLLWYRLRGYARRVSAPACAGVKTR
jgi:hypothetical protein